MSIDHLVSFLKESEFTQNDFDGVIEYTRRFGEKDKMDVTYYNRYFSVSIIQYETTCDMVNVITHEFDDEMHVMQFVSALLTAYAVKYPS